MTFGGRGSLLGGRDFSRWGKRISKFSAGRGEGGLTPSPQKGKPRQ